MKQMQWDSSLSVGIELIDDQHKMWIRHLNDTSSAIGSRASMDRIAETLGFLVDYTHFHFSTEEKHMTQNNYPGLGEHKKKHNELKGTLNNLVQDFEEEGVTPLLADSIDTLLGNWLVKHIREVDMQFGAFLRDKGITIPKEA